MKKLMLFFYFISIVCVIACSPKKIDYQISGRIINPTETNIKIGTQTIPISKNGEFFYTQEVERAVFLDVSYANLEWIIFLMPNSNISILVPEKNSMQ